MLVESFWRSALELSQIRVEHHLLISDEIDTLCDAFLQDDIEQMTHELVLVRKVIRAKSERISIIINTHLNSTPPSVFRNGAIVFRHECVKDP